MSIISYRHPFDSLADGAFETDGPTLYFSIGGARYQLVQVEQIAQLNKLVSLLTLELVEQGWPVKSQELLDLLNTSLANSIQR